MIEFKYNKKGILEVWKDKKKIGEMITIGDELDERRSQNDLQPERVRGRTKKGR